MIGRAADMIDFLVIEQFCKITREIGGAIVRQQSRAKTNIDLIQPAFSHRQIQRVSDALRLHRHAELPCENIARVVVQNRQEVAPTPADNLQIGDGFMPLPPPPPRSCFFEAGGSQA